MYLPHILVFSVYVCSSDVDIVRLTDNKTCLQFRVHLKNLFLGFSRVLTQRTEKKKKTRIVLFTLSSHCESSQTVCKREERKDSGHQPAHLDYFSAFTMSGMINNLGTKLFKSVADKAGDLGEKFEEEFSKLALNITTEVDTVVTEVVSLSGYIKVALVILCILLVGSLDNNDYTNFQVLMIIRLSAFGIRCMFFKARDWMLANENRPPPQVILMMPQDEANDKKASRVYSDVQTKNILDKIQQESMELFTDPPAYRSSIKSGRNARLTRGIAEEV